MVINPRQFRTCREFPLRDETVICTDLSYWHLRPKADINQLPAMLRSQPALLPFVWIAAVKHLTMARDAMLGLVLIQPFAVNHQRP